MSSNLELLYFIKHGEQSLYIYIIAMGQAFQYIIEVNWTFS